MINTEVKYGLSDVVMLPAPVSSVSSRSQCCPFDASGMLPLITSPMYSVVNAGNIHLYTNAKIYGIFPRGSSEIRPLAHTFVAYGLDEFIDRVRDAKEPKPEDPVEHALIDIANGNMKKLLDAVGDAKAKFGERIVIMAGNIAHPETYDGLSRAGADYVRLGIGSGQACTTSANCSVHYPMASLIDACLALKRARGLRAKIIADGGFRNFDDIIKALGLGADLVMLGSIFNKALESAGATYVKSTVDMGSDRRQGLKGGYKVDQFSPEISEAFKNGLDLIKEYYGMSTKRAQREMGHENLKTSEGIIKMNPVAYTLEQWVENFKHYLTTAMSYTGHTRLEDFIGGVNFQVITPDAFLAFIK